MSRLNSQENIENKMNKLKNLPTKLLSDLNVNKISNFDLFNNSKKTHMSSISSVVNLQTLTASNTP